MDEAIYYMNTGGSPIGPVTRESFEALRASGVITNQTLVRAGDLARWVPYSEFVWSCPTSDAKPQPRSESTAGRNATNAMGGNVHNLLKLAPVVVAGLVGSHLSRLFYGTPIASALLTGLSFMVGSLIGIFLYALAVEAINRTVERRGTAAIVTSFGLSVAFLAILLAVPDPIAGHASNQVPAARRVAVAPVPAGTATSPDSSPKAQDAPAGSADSSSMSATQRGFEEDNAAAASGIADAKKGDYKAAFAELKPLAERGNVVAAFNIGVMYEHGNGVTQSYISAAKWYRLAASAGVVQAELNLGILYDTGKGVPRDYVEAAKWYRQAAMHGVATAQYNLGEMYATGQGVPHDEIASLAWMRKAADGGVALAQYNMGVAYTEGQNVAPDATLALAWYRKAAAQGLAIAQFNIGVMFAQGLGVSQNYSQAAAWFLLAAEQKYALAETYLARLYLKGHGVPQNAMVGAALMDLSATTDDSSDNPAAQARIRLMQLLTQQQWAAVETLARQMQHGDLKAIINAEVQAQQ